MNISVAVPIALREQRTLTFQPLLTTQNPSPALIDMLGWYRRTMAEHAQSTAIQARALAEELHLSPVETFLVTQSAFFHDIGKITIPATILNKPGPLTDQEWNMVRRHPEIGYHMLIQAGGTWSYIAPFVLAHHERWDGQGYPYRLAGEHIPLGARILAVADAYTAMTERRPYRQHPLTKSEALIEVQRCAGSAYDPAVVAAFLRLAEDSMQVAGRSACASRSIEKRADSAPMV